MQLTISGKQSNLGDALRGHIEELLQVLVGRYFENPTDSHNTMFKPGTNIRADVAVHVGIGILFQSHTMAGDAFAASCEATEHVCTWFRGCKWHLRDRHRDRADHSNNWVALVFRNISHGGLNIIYQRASGNIDWINPHGSRGNFPKGN